MPTVRPALFWPIKLAVFGRSSTKFRPELKVCSPIHILCAHPSYFQQNSNSNSKLNLPRTSIKKKKMYKKLGSGDYNKGFRDGMSNRPSDLMSVSNTVQYYRGYRAGQRKRGRKYKPHGAVSFNDQRTLSLIHGLKYKKYHDLSPSVSVTSTWSFLQVTQSIILGTANTERIADHIHVMSIAADLNLLWNTSATTAADHVIKLTTAE